MTDITVEIPAASKPETAYLQQGKLVIDYHKWHKDIYDYIDATIQIPTNELVQLGMIYGTRGGFHRMELVYGRDFEVLKLSGNHKEVILMIYNICKKLPVELKKYIEEGGEK